MRYLILALIGLTIFICSCKKTNSDFKLTQGTYVGTFQRLTSSGGQISDVTITFSANKWTGQSQFSKYPALCQGTYKVNNADNISFENACPWTAEFDWSLILSQDYQIRNVAHAIEISRDYNGAYKDIYRLTKQ